MSKQKIILVHRDESPINFVIRFPRGKTIDDIQDVIFLVKSTDASPLATSIIEKLYSNNQITLAEKDIANVFLTVNDYQNIEVGKLYRAALFCKWIGNVDFDENVEYLFDFQTKQSFHNNL